jgi:uncharacterized protein YneF (UPF0154 family)
MRQHIEKIKALLRMHRQSLGVLVLALLLLVFVSGGHLAAMPSMPAQPSYASTANNTAESPCAALCTGISLQGSQYFLQTPVREKEPAPPPVLTVSVSLAAGLILLVYRSRRAPKTALYKLHACLRY